MSEHVYLKNQTIHNYAFAPVLMHQITPKAATIQPTTVIESGKPQTTKHSAIIREWEICKNNTQQ